ncbi:hypothetical protein IEQ34_002923 [Dendrobium chrysotoxum]|uniref:Uncharacterized protein n=1 Tax=Dendrobium chrysotoxum TaxID=161865 RepID=A0AAV7HID9_DENCH|nr:hypothetical protein IEQ34_002923 [Dendrobium chrysotoxum]
MPRANLTRVHRRTCRWRAFDGGVFLGKPGEAPGKLSGIEVLQPLDFDPDSGWFDLVKNRGTRIHPLYGIIEVKRVMKTKPRRVIEKTTSIPPAHQEEFMSNIKNIANDVDDQNYNY